MKSPVVLSGTDAVTATWLTDVLHISGALSRGIVAAVGAHPNPDAFNSVITHLTLTYSPDAITTAPTRLLLKRNLPAAWAVRDAEREVAFYRRVMPLRAALPMLVPCYGAAFDAARGASYILMDDLSETHDIPITRERVLALDGVPPEWAIHNVLNALARFHAYWWEHPTLGDAVLPLHNWYRDRAACDAFCLSAAADWQHFIADEEATFPVGLRALYERAIAGLPSLWNRYLAARIAARTNLTASNGDSYFAQFLCPKEGVDGSTFIIDFQAPRTSVPTLDLVFLFATFWTPAQRAEHDREIRLLRRYHDALRAAGVTGYDWDTLLTDYRLMVYLMIFFPLWDQVNGSKCAYWWTKMRCITGAFTDLRCADLII